MSLKCLLLACLVAAASAQSGQGTPDPTTLGPMTTESPTDVAQQMLSLEVRYDLPQAVMTREQHFFCPTQGGSFVNDEPRADNMPIKRVWTLFLQYPLLAYLDSVKKQALIGQIVSLINTGNSGLGLSTSNICIGNVYHYDVSLYTESVLLNIYLQNNMATPTEINDAFMAGVTKAASNSSDYRIRDFLGRNAIALSSDTYGMIEQNAHPGSFIRDGIRFAVGDDPVLNAIILGSWDQQYSLSDFTSNRMLNATVSEALVPNPNPINGGLTGGDIVFTVIATVLCCLLAFLMVFGFCIQPFLM